MLTALLRLAPALENHLWQSTAFAAVAWLLAFVLRKNQARPRYWIWFAASMKFLLPFSLLFAVGSYLRPARVVVIAPAPVAAAVQQIARPFSDVTSAAPSAVPAGGQNSSILLVALFAIWAGGFLAVTFSQWRGWHRVRKACAAATPARLGGTGTPACVHLNIPVKFSPSLLEPGVFGIFRPVLLLPQGIADRLTPAQMNAILAHEMSHICRRDNLTAALHMLSEAIFWFYPVVWWIGARLVEERENACDEEVMRLVGEPETYAEGILEVCKFYTESPVICVSGVSGADFKNRIVRIMTRHLGRNLSRGRKILLGAIAIAAIAVPLVFGVLNPAQLRAQSSRDQQAINGPLPSFEVASIKAADPDTRGLTKHAPGIPDQPDMSQFRAPAVTAKTLIAAAYDVKEFQVSGGPSWIGSELWDIDAKVDDSLAARLEKLPRRQQEAQRALMLRSLLADRFKLQVTQSSKQADVLALVVAKGGPKFKAVPPLDPNAPRPSTPYLAQTPRGTLREVPPGAALMMMNLGRATMVANAQPIGALVDMLSTHLGEPVVDRTGLKGTYQFALEFAPQGGAGPDGMPLPPGPPPDPSVPSLFTALQEQLGLKLESAKGPIEIITIDHIEEPSEN